MKKMIFAVVAMLMALVSCQEKESKLNLTDLIGEWKAMKMEIMSDDGDSTVLTDEESLMEELEEMFWISVSEFNIRSLSSDIDLQIPYEISGNSIIFTNGDNSATYRLESVSANEMKIRRTDNQTSIISYQKIK